MLGPRAFVTPLHALAPATPLDKGRKRSDEWQVKRIAEHVEEPTLSSNQLFIFTVTYCQRTEEACALRVTQLLLLSIPRYVFAVHPVKLYWTASALSCQQLELTELRQT